MSGPPTRTIGGAAASLAGIALLATGCFPPSSADVTRLAERGDDDGLLRVLERDAARPEVRAQAASLLLARGHDRVVERTLVGLPPAAQGPVVAYLLDAHLPRLLASDPESGRRALLQMRGYGDPLSVARTDRLLVDSVADAIGRRRAEIPAAVLLESLRVAGPGAPERLMRLVDQPGAPYDLVLELLEEQPALRARALGRMQERFAGEPMPERTLWVALARHGERALLEREVKGGGARAVAAASALAFATPDPAVVRMAMQVAADTAAEQPIRLAMLGVVESIGSAGDVDELLAFIRRQRQAPLAYRAYLAAVVLGGEDAVVPALASFPRRLVHRPEDISPQLVAGALWLGPETARQVAARALRSRAPLARLTGVLLLERVGQRSDAGLLSRLTRDRGRVPGLGQEDQIGAQARRVRAQLLAPAPTREPQDQA